ARAGVVENGRLITHPTILDARRRRWLHHGRRQSSRMTDQHVNPLERFNLLVIEEAHRQAPFRPDPKHTARPPDGSISVSVVSSGSDPHAPEVARSKTAHVLSSPKWAGDGYFVPAGVDDDLQLAVQPGEHRSESERDAERHVNPDADHRTVSVSPVEKLKA